MEALERGTVDKALSEGLAWQREGDELVKIWKGKDFSAALAYVNAVGALAERAGHHPDIDIRWNVVTLRLSTHSIGALTQADIDLAAQIDALQQSA
jgi:4a-hydroxytetrahydrobiopterin dehydratase